METQVPKWKTAILTWLGITPLLLAFQWLTRGLLMHLPSEAKVLVTTPILVPIMTYLLMPGLRHLFRPWLREPPKDQPMESARKPLRNP